MKDHGMLDDDETIQVLGEMLIRMRDQLRFTSPGASALTGFSIDGEAYEIRLTRKVSDD